MDIRNIKTFVTAAELNSFTKAADRLNYVQSTVTMQIQQLEHELGYTLFDRIGKKIFLTSLGSEFLCYAYEILRIADKAENLGKVADSIGGTLRIGVTESLMFCVLMDMLPVFKEKYKNIDISVKSGHMPELVEELKQNRLDILYISASLNIDSALRCHYVREEELAFIVAPTHDTAKNKKISINELMQYDFIVTEREGICYSRLCELTAKYKASLKNSVEIDSVYVITEFVKKGMGLAFLPEYSVSKQLKEGSLVKINADIPPQTYYTQILCHKNRWISPFMQAFIDMIKQIRPTCEI